MPTPITDSGKIVINYVLAALSHVHTMYVGEPAPSGGSFVLPKRADVGGSGQWEDVADSLAEAISNIMPSSTADGTATLFQFDGVLWNPIAAKAVTFPDQAGTIQAASQATLTFRDESFHRPKVVVMEHTQNTPGHFISPTGGSPAMDALIAEYTDAFTTTEPPWHFFRSIWGDPLLDGGFVSATFTFNRVLRKARLLA